MSEGITHTAIVDDTIGLIKMVPDICHAFRLAVGEHPELAVRLEIGRPELAG